MTHTFWRVLTWGKPVGLAGFWAIQKADVITCTMAWLL